MNKLHELYRKYKPLRLRDLRVGDIFATVYAPEVVYVLTSKNWFGKSQCVGVCPHSKAVAVFSCETKVIKKNALCIVQ